MLTSSPLHPTTLARKRAEELFAALQMRPAGRASMRTDDALALPSRAPADKPGGQLRAGHGSGTLSLRRGG